MIQVDNRFGKLSATSIKTSSYLDQLPSNPEHQPVYSVTPCVEELKHVSRVPVEVAEMKVAGWTCDQTDRTPVEIRSECPENHQKTAAVMLSTVGSLHLRSLVLLAKGATGSLQAWNVSCSGLSPGRCSSGRAAVAAVEHDWW